MPRSDRIACAAALALCLVWMLVLAATRGLWLDEFWTVFLSQHDVPLPTAFRTRWAADVHPPLYTFYTWLMEPLAGGSKFTMRATNIIAFPAIAGAVALFRRYDDRPGFIWLFLLITASSPFTIVYFAEYRSYFLELSASLIVVLLLHIVHFLRRDIGWRQDAALVLSLCLAIPIGVNLHFISAVAILIFCFIQFCYQLYSRHWRTAALLAAVVFMACLPLAAAVVMVVVNDPPPAPNHTGALKGLFMVGAFAGTALAGNVAAFAFALVGIVKRRSRPEQAAPDELAYPWVLAAMLAVAALAFVVLNALSPFLTWRYLIALIPAATALTAWLAVRPTIVCRRGVTLVAVNAALLATAIGFHQTRNQRWETNLRDVVAAARSCPTTRIYTLYTLVLFSPDHRLRPEVVENSRRAFFRGYDYMARQHGIHVIDLPRAAPPTLDARCPTLLWVEQNFAVPHPTAETLLDAAGFTPGMLRNVDVTLKSRESHQLVTLTPRTS